MPMLTCRLSNEQVVDCAERRQGDDPRVLAGVLDDAAYRRALEPAILVCF